MCVCMPVRAYVCKYVCAIAHTWRSQAASSLFQYVGSGDKIRVVGL